MKIKLCRIHDHQHKSDAYRQALADAGYLFTDRENVNGLRFYLSDGDWDSRKYLDDARSRNIPVFLYPHAARPMVIYDGCVKPRPVTAMFTQAPGGKALMEKIGYPYPVEVSGWAFCEVRPFAPITEIGRILFAPIHANGNGYLNRIDKDINRRTYERLFAFCKNWGAELSVRYIDSLEKCGLDGVEVEDFVEMHKGKKNNSTLDIETADIVVSHQTFAWMAVALGIPTVMMAEDVPPRSGNSDESFCFVEHWDDYKADLMFPLDILAEDPETVIGKACAGYSAVEDWKARLIGEPFDGPAFVAKLESYL